MTTGTPVVAPPAPAAWGRPAEPAAMQRYLEDLRGWRDGRRAELDALDEAALAAPDPDAVAGDVTLAMALWQAVAARHDELERVWDGGRVGPVELQRLSSLVWGRLDASGAGGTSLAVSLPEACRLSDALADGLRDRLALDPVGADVATRLRALRAALERVRDLAGAEPRGARRDTALAGLRGLELRVTELAARAGRGADVGGLVGPLDADLARAERDLIVGEATRREDARERAAVVAQRAGLAARADAVGALVDACVTQVRPAPVLGVPRVDALGPVPDEPDAVDAYARRLAAVARALDRVEEAYRTPVAELADLRALVDAWVAKAGATGRGGLPEVTALRDVAAALLADPPVDLPRLRALVAALGALVGAGVPPGPPAPPPVVSSSTSSSTASRLGTLEGRTP